MGTLVCIEELLRGAQNQTILFPPENVDLVLSALHGGSLEKEKSIEGPEKVVEENKEGMPPAMNLTKCLTELLKGLHENSEMALIISVLEKLTHACSRKKIKAGAPFEPKALLEEVKREESEGGMRVENEGDSMSSGRISSEEAMIQEHAATGSQVSLDEYHEYDSMTEEEDDELMDEEDEVNSESDEGVDPH